MSISEAGEDSVYRVRLEKGGRAVAVGTYCNSMDFGADAAGARVSWTADLNGGGLKVSIRTAASYAGSFSEWSEIANGSVLSGFRHLEYRVEMKPSSSGQSPVLYDLAVTAVH